MHHPQLQAVWRSRARFGGSGIRKSLSITIARCRAKVHSLFCFVVATVAAAAAAAAAVVVVVVVVVVSVVVAAAASFYLLCMCRHTISYALSLLQQHQMSTPPPLAFPSLFPPFLLPPPSSKLP